MQATYTVTNTDKTTVSNLRGDRCLTEDRIAIAPSPNIPVQLKRLNQARLTLAEAALLRRWQSGIPEREQRLFQEIYRRRVQPIGRRA
jgi:hypothetical protein